MVGHASGPSRWDLRLGLHLWGFCNRSRSYVYLYKVFLHVCELRGMAIVSPPCLETMVDMYSIYVYVYIHLVFVVYINAYESAAP